MPTITIYTTPSCGFCHMAKEFMKEHHMPFTDVNVAADPAKAEEMIHKSGQMGVPVIAVNRNGSEEIIIGYDQERLAEIAGEFVPAS